MRRLLLWVPEGGGDALRAAAQRGGATQALTLTARTEDGQVDLLWVHVPNDDVERVVDEVGDMAGLHMSMLPQGVLALQPPPEQAPDQVLDVTLRSPLEVLMSGLQSIGSWTGFLSYAALAGAVVWVGLFTNTVYLLTAAMLIAPFAGPAMNTALATARGDVELLRRTIGRYVAGLTVASLVAALCSLLFRQDVVTTQMIDTATISTAAVVLPLAAGAAGAVNLSQSERSSLVSGAATGMLVAAALAPPAGLVGMAAVMGEWSLLRGALFLLGLQLVGINLSGAAVFRLVGLRPHGVRYPRGHPAASIGTALATVVLLGGFLAWQFSDPVDLQRSTLSQRAEAAVQQTLERMPSAELVEVDARFAQSNLPDLHVLLVAVDVMPPISPATGGAPDADRLRQQLQDILQQRLADVVPLVDVTVLVPPQDAVTG